MATIWDSEAYWAKARWYARRASELEAEEAGHAVLHRCLALEFLARAVLCNVHPALNADPTGDGSHLLYAFNFNTTKQPKSLPMHGVYGRLARMYPDFAPSRAICDYLSNLRNEELHSSALPFEALEETEWLADYYGAVKTLTELLRKPLEDLLCDEAPHAIELVAARATERRGEVLKRIAACGDAFRLRTPEEQAQLRMAGEIVVAAEPGERVVECPACACVTAALNGKKLRESEPVYDGGDGELYADNTYATEEMRCGACGLLLRSVDECAIAGIKPRYIVRSRVDLHMMHQNEVFDEYDNM